jgi:O-antigen ligase
MASFFQELFDLRKRPYIISECFVCIFLIFMLVLQGPRFSKFATLSGGMVVMTFAIEVLVRGHLAEHIRNLKPMIPYMMFLILSVLLLPLISYAGSRVWNNGTGMAILISTFLIVRKMGHTKLMDYAFPLAVIGLCFFMFVAPSLIGAGASTSGKRVNFSSNFTGGGLGASHLSVVVGIAYFMALRGLLDGGIYLKRLLRPDTIMYLTTLLFGFYLIVVRSGSRQGLIWILIAGTFCYALYSRKNIILGILFTIPVALVTMGVLYFFFSETQTVSRIIAIFDPFNQTFDPEQSFDYRMEMIVAGWELWQQSPLWGHGNEAFRVKADFGGFYSHNNYIELLVNYGALGLFLFYCPLVYALYVSVKGFLQHRHDQLKREYLWLGFAIIALMVSNIFMPSYYMKHVLVFMAMILGRFYYLQDNEARIMRSRPRMPQRNFNRRMY